jgi:hypothetical protein
VVGSESRVREPTGIVSPWWLISSGEALDSCRQARAEAEPAVVVSHVAEPGYRGDPGAGKRTDMDAVARAPGGSAACHHLTSRAKSWEFSGSGPVLHRLGFVRPTLLIRVPSASAALA